jgi:hypothetical protein
MGSVLKMGAAADPGMASALVSQLLASDRTAGVVDDENDKKLHNSFHIYGVSETYEPGPSNTNCRDWFRMHFTTRLKSKLEGFGVALVGDKLPWGSFGSLLATNGLMLVNYPNNQLILGLNVKGMSDLKTGYRKAIVRSMGMVDEDDRIDLVRQDCGEFFLATFLYYTLFYPDTLIEILQHLKETSLLCGEPLKEFVEDCKSLKCSSTSGILGTMTMRGQLWTRRLLQQRGRSRRPGSARERNHAQPFLP